MRQDRPFPAWWRCALCGRFMKRDAKVVDISHANYMDYEPPDPEWAHEECARRLL